MGLFSRSADIGELRSRRDFAGLADVLKKSDDDQRRQAVEAIAELNDPAAVPPVVEMMSRLRTRSETHESAEQAIGRLGAAAVEPLKDLVRRDGSTTAASQLARLGETLGLDPLRELARDPGSEAREAAYGGLVELSGPAAVAALAEGAETGPGRREAIEAMAYSSACAGDARAVRAAITALAEDDDDLRVPAGQVLTKMAKRVREGEAPRDPMLREFVAGTRHEDLRVRLGSTVGVSAVFEDDEQMPAEASDALLQACSDEHEGVRAVAALCLAKRGDHRVFDTLIASLSSDDPEFAATGAVGLKLLGDPAALPAIRARLEAESDKGSPLAREIVHARNDLKGAEKKLAKGAAG